MLIGHKLQSMCESNWKGWGDSVWILEALECYLKEFGLSSISSKETLTVLHSVLFLFCFCFVLGQRTALFKVLFQGKSLHQRCCGEGRMHKQEKAVVSPSLKWQTAFSKDTLFHIPRGLTIWHNTTCIKWWDLYPVPPEAEWTFVSADPRLQLMVSDF